MAAVEEESFPRGGTYVKKSEHVKLKSGKEKDQDLFKTKTDDFGRAGKKRKSSEKKDKSKAKKLRVETGPVFSPNAGQVELLTLKTLSPGVLTLGVVREIHDYGLGLSLPNGLSGTVPITDISQTYTSLLEQLADSSTDQEVHGLHELFTVGQIVHCKVSDVKTIKNGKASIKLSIKPSDVNSVLKPSLLKTGLVLCGTVESQEDHGYIIDLGVKGVKAFLSNDDAEKFIQTCNEGFSLKLGQYLHCAVESSDHLGILAGESRSVHVSIDPSKVKAAKVVESMKLPLSAVVPGLTVPGIVEKVLEDGLRVSFLSYRGGIHSTHLPRPPHKYEAQQKVEACVLFVHPTTKSVSLSLLPHLTSDPAKPCSPFRGVQLGDVVEEAEVTWVDKRRGVGFRLSQTVAAFCPTKNLSDKKVADVQTKFAKGSSHKCRVIGFDYVDGVAVISLKKSVIEREFTKLTDIPLGSVVECRVRALHEGGMSVQVTDRIRGFVPSLHLADVPLKHPEKKFKEGDKLKCRVLQHNPGKSSLVLTNKRSLVSSTFPVVTSYQDVTPGLELEGFIASISDRGVLVVFYNRVKGWVRKEDLGTERVDYPEKVFYLGQVVHCRVHSVHPEQERMKLSFKLSRELPSTKVNSKPPPPDFKIGKILDCRVLRKKNLGLDVIMLPSECLAYLPMMHLSDSPTNRPLLMAQYQPGDVIREVMYLAHTAQSDTLVTRKFSFLQASREGHLVSDFSEIQPGIQLPGTVKNIMDYGLFVEFPGSMIGLAPNKFVCDKHLTDIRSEFPIGTSVNAKVVEVKLDKERFLVSLRLADCYHGNTENVVEMLSAQLQEKEEAALAIKSKKGKTSKHASKAANLKMGNIVKVTVTEVGKHHVTCDLGHGLRGVCSVHIIPDHEVTEGDEMEAVVLNVNLSEPSVDVSLCPKLVHAVKNVKQNRFSMAREGQGLKGEVILVKEDYVVAALKGHAQGRFVYLPCRKHPNDVLFRRSLHLGQVKSLLVKSVEKDVLIGNWLEVEASTGENTLADQIYDISKPSQRLGSIANALVKAVHDLQINVIVKNSPGRVHISEVEGSDVIGSLPMKKYKKLVGQRISVKIVGFREVKTHRFLPISHKSAVKPVLECSTIARKLEKHGMKSGDALKVDSYNVGDTVLAYVDHFSSHYLWFAISPTFRGRAHILNLSTKPKVLDKREVKFKPGQVCEATVISVMDSDCLELSLVGPTAKVEVGSLTRGIIVGQTKNGDALNVHLLDDCVGRVWLTDVMDRFTDHPFSRYKTGQCVVCSVVSMTTTDEEGEESSDGHKVCGLSLRPSRCKPGKGSNPTDPEVRVLSDLTEGQVLRGFVVKTIGAGVLLSVGCGLTGLALYDKASKCYIKDSAAAYPPGKVVTAKILRIDTEKKSIALSFLEEDTGVPENLSDSVEKCKRLKKMSQDEETAEKNTHTDTETDKSVRKSRKRPSHVDDVAQDVKRAKKENSGNTKKSKEKGGKREMAVEAGGGEDSGVDTDDEVAVQRSPDSALPRLQLSTDFSWDADYITQQPPAGQGEVTSDDEQDDQSEQKSRHKTNKAKLKEKSREEKKLFELEREQLEGSQQPQTAEDFDRLVLQSPDSSLVWLRYIAHHLELTEIEKARAVAERALQTINFREEQEKVNVWVGYLNLENLYGTPETLAKVLGRAVQQTEPLGIYQQLVNIYVKSAKIEEAEKLYQTMVKRFSANKDVWVSFGMFHFKHDKVEAGRRLMQRSLQSLSSRDHVEVISKFAQLEFKFGESERGKTMFENILSSYPKRTDLWSVYIDMVTRLEQLDSARQLFERVINSKLSVKKMKFFFKKYLDFETAHGTEASMLAVKQKALEYVDSKGSLEEL